MIFNSKVIKSVSPDSVSVALMLTKLYPKSLVFDVSITTSKFVLSIVTKVYPDSFVKTKFVKAYAGSHV